jgi:hypothetical protein
MHEAKERLQGGRKIFQFSFPSKKDTKEEGLWLNELERKNKKQERYCKDKNHQLRLFLKLYGNFRSAQDNHGQAQTKKLEQQTHAIQRTHGGVKKLEFGVEQGKGTQQNPRNSKKEGALEQYGFG